MRLVPVPNSLLVAEKLAVALLAEHGLVGWSFGWDRAKARGGACHYDKQTITLSPFYVERSGYMEVRDTILHEIAHALAGSGAGHGPVWKSFCLTVGATPERLLEEGVEVAERQWVGICSGCGHRWERHRVRRGTSYHRRCGEEIVWIRKDGA